ncbi:MAG: serine--tRNA ligase [Pseudomonadota bacterium]
MHDIKRLREDPDGFDAALARRGNAPAASAILEVDAKHRAALQALQDMQARRNTASKAIGAAKAKGAEDDAQALMAEVAQLKVDMPAVEEEARAFGQTVSEHLSSLPNRPADDVPDGDGEDDNIEVRSWGAPTTFSFEPKEHDAVGAPLGMDFEAAAAMSGARFVVLRGQVARLERALGQFMLDQQTQNYGYEEVTPPILVWDKAMFGTGQLPKFAEDSFKTTADHWLIPTAEVALTNLAREQIIAEDMLPMRLTALTPCFRSEAGSAGRDTKGMIRQHQFSKVELVSITAPENSVAEHERMTKAAEAILKALGLPFRTMVLCTGDMGFGAIKTYDLEVWLPGQQRYREISSCSNCGDFQARRMNARMRRDGAKQTEFVHTLNGSGLAVGRTLVAVLENYQNMDGSITIPDVLQPYLGGLTKLESK